MLCNAATGYLGPGLSGTTGMSGLLHTHGLLSSRQLDQLVNKPSARLKLPGVALANESQRADPKVMPTWRDNSLESIVYIRSLKNVVIALMWKKSIPGWGHCL